MQNKKKIIGSVIIFIIFVIFLGVGYYISKPSKEFNSKEVFNEAPTVESKDNKEITVYINGEVKNPGVYKIKNDSRVDELVKMSGGFTESADKLKLNLAKKLKDEDYIYVDKKVEGQANAAANSAQLSAGTITTQGGKININSASKEELKTIPGIGDITAQKIIDYRTKNGNFSSIEDLKKIDRMGDKTLDKIKDKIDVR